MLNNGKKLHVPLSVLARCLKLDINKLVDINISKIEEIYEKYMAKEKAQSEYEKLLKSLGFEEKE